MMVSGDSSWGLRLYQLKNTLICKSNISNAHNKFDVGVWELIDPDSVQAAFFSFNCEIGSSSLLFLDTPLESI